MLFKDLFEGARTPPMTLYHFTPHPDSYHPSEIGKGNPVTWFVASHYKSSYGRDAAGEMRGYSRNSRDDRRGGGAIHVYRAREKLRLASEKHIHAAAQELRPDHDAENVPAYEVLDHNVTGDSELTHHVVRRLKEQGFHGAVHGDYSSDFEHDRKSVALFDPHEHLDHVGTHGPDSLDSFHHKNPPARGSREPDPLSSRHWAFDQSRNRGKIANGAFIARRAEILGTPKGKLP